MFISEETTMEIMGHVAFVSVMLPSAEFVIFLYIYLYKFIYIYAY